VTRYVRLLAIVAAFLGAMVWWVGRVDPGPGDGPNTGPNASEMSDPAGNETSDPVVGVTDAGAAWIDEDWAIFESKVRWAAREGLAELEPGEAVGRLAESFVGTPYTPGTLEADGPEALVINFREFDCVTFVENMLAMTRFIRAGGVDLLPDRAAAEARYGDHLTALRYRDGSLAGYSSRLHYFSEWLSDNAERGLVTVVTGELDPALDEEPIDFMSTHPDAYRQLTDPAVLEAIRSMEDRLNTMAPRSFVPQDRIGSIAEHIATGDVIAATSTVEGLDIAHTGLALSVDGRLHMIHAPLVGSSVEISEVPLADRIRTISGQDGIMVARWSERPDR